MTADIKYIVKYHARPVRKVAGVLFGFGVLIIVLLDLIWAPFNGLTPELQALAILHILPDIFWDMNNIAMLCIVTGFGFWLLRWRTGKIELTEDKLVIQGSYPISIWLRNMWEADVRDMKYRHWIIRIDSNVDAVQVKFKTEREFEEFSEKLVQFVGQVENIKLKTTTSDEIRG